MFIVLSLISMFFVFIGFSLTFCLFIRLPLSLYVERSQTLGTLLQLAPEFYKQTTINPIYSNTTTLQVDALTASLLSDTSGSTQRHYASGANNLIRIMACWAPEGHGMGN